MVPGSQRNPTAGLAGISSPHQKASAASYPAKPPKVRKTVVAPWALTLTPVGLTRIWASAGRFAIAATARTDRRRFGRMVNRAGSNHRH